MAAPILAVTHWFEPAERAGPFPVTVRFVGQRLGIEGKPVRGDAFTHDETILQVVPGSGPIALTAKVRDINPGEWAVRASVVPAPAPRGRGKMPEPPAVRPLRDSLDGWTRLWLKWAPPADPAVPLHTQVEPLAHVPGLIPLIWGTLVGLGIVVAVVTQAIIAAHLRLAGPVTLATVGAIGLGAVGAKLWYIVKQRGQLIGWCIQGFITGGTLGALLLFTLLHLSLGAALDAVAPGLMLGLAVGRIGCFFAGCCGGPPTTARWGVWCSDAHVGAKRLPTQLLESLFSLVLGIVTFAWVWLHGPAGGAYFVLVVAAYTLFREWILRLRSEAFTTRLPVALMPVVSVLAVVASLVFIVR
ncbi:MAG TPA: prolipoprotein diacylglyceryl transferase family protein [Ktedonobacterales bacterium]|nr:prolipoprotein diacylglyceryl transferase family protein [Ktedonobacterales bacterium]